MSNRESRDGVSRVVSRAFPSPGRDNEALSIKKDLHLLNNSRSVYLHTCQGYREPGRNRVFASHIQHGETWKCPVICKTKGGRRCRQGRVCLSSPL